MAAALELGRAHPQSVQAHIALTKAGFYYYLNNQRDQAITAWQLLGGGATSTDSAEGYFWAGNALVQAGKGAEAGAQLQAAIEAAPQSFYGMRARELLKQPLDGQTALGTGPSADERSAAAQWIDGWFKSDLPNVGEAVNGAPEVVRARELLRLGLRNESRDELTSARDAWKDDPLRLWYLALQAHDAGDAYIGLKTAERVVAISPDKRITPKTPTGLLRLIYPTPYLRVVQREAQQFGLDPRLLYALIRQESLFNPDATSWVGARGLAQVMPSTAEGIAQNLQVANFSPDQLYQPAVSIRFGAHYLSHQLRAFDNNPLAAASAYNGGPGNAARWLENTADRDLFAELIDYRETRDYVKIVYGNWGMYRLLYKQS
jgi:soluble lytic murein transglycosylase